MKSVPELHYPSKRIPMLQWVQECPYHLGFEKLEDGRLEVYVWILGERLSYIPISPEDLWTWLHLFITDHYEAFLKIGLKPIQDKRPIQRDNDLAGVNIEALLKRLQSLNLEKNDENG